MGLFKKKPKSVIVQQPGDKPLGAPLTIGTSPDDTTLPKLAPKPDKKPAKPEPAPKPVKAKKSKGGGVDPADFLALRSELRDVKARLDESEQARAVVEARLSSLDATTAAFSTERADVSEMADMILQLQQQVSDRGTNTGGGGGISTFSSDAHDELSAKVDAIHNRMLGIQDQSPKIAEFESQIAQMRAELETSAAAAAEAAADAAALPPPVSAPQGPDPDMLERIAAVQQRVNDIDQIRHRLGEIDHIKQRLGDIDHIKTRLSEIDHLHERVAGVDALQQRMGELDGVHERLATIDGLGAQLNQLNARVAAQAEMGAQLSALRDRMSQMSEQPQGVDDDTRLQLQEIGERLRASEALQGQVGQLAERVTANDTEARAVREHMAVLDQRLTNVSTELANQLSELGRDIDGLGQRIPEVADGTVSDEVFDALKGGQVKLANEQARYEIAFRQDLATLAEQLRTGRTDDPN
jgi:DNA repair exonuclease SbcCD ATPase subunit